MMPNFIYLFKVHVVQTHIWNPHPVDKAHQHGQTHDEEERYPGVQCPIAPDFDGN